MQLSNISVYLFYCCYGSWIYSSPISSWLLAINKFRIHFESWFWFNYLKQVSFLIPHYLFQGPASTKILCLTALGWFFRVEVTEIFGWLNASHATESNFAFNFTTEYSCYRYNLFIQTCRQHQGLLTGHHFITFQMHIQPQILQHCQFLHSIFFFLLATFK